MRDYIHYGFSNNEFDPFFISKAKNSDYAIKVAKMADRFAFMMDSININKPQGGTGFWASRIDSEYGWKKWSEENEYKLSDLSKAFKFSLTPDARVFKISSDKDVKLLTEKYHLKKTKILDFEKMQDEYDAIEVTTMKNGVYHALYSWDCESILILNPRIIKYNRLLNLTNQNIRICDEPIKEGQHINFTWECWFDVDDYFGTDINDDDESWINFYTNMYEDGSIDAFYVIDTPNMSETHYWGLDDEETAFLKRKMKECISEHFKRGE